MRANHVQISPSGNLFTYFAFVTCSLPHVNVYATGFKRLENMWFLLLAENTTRFVNTVGGKSVLKPQLKKKLHTSNIKLNPADYLRDR